MIARKNLVRFCLTASRLATAILVMALGSTGSYATAAELPERSGPAAITTTGVPHVQLDAELAPDVKAELLRRVAKLPKLDVRPTVISLPGTAGFWLLEDLQLKRPEVIAGGREFAHVHPDGSLHASLPPERAREAIAAGWAVSHPWSQKREGWDGFVMLFTPRTMDELEIIFGLVVDGYNFVTGQELNAEDFQGG